MSRAVLLGVLLLLGIAVVMDLSRRVPLSRGSAAAAATRSQRATPSAAAPKPLVPSATPTNTASTALPEPAGATPALDLLARLAVRRRIVREGTSVYLDSLFPVTDSVLARWNARPIVTVGMFADTTLADWSPARFDDVRAALQAWDANGSGIALRETPLADSADIQVHWVEALPDTGQVGATTLTWGSDGVARSASIRLALRRKFDNRLVPPDARIRVAAHELGHALGLPHSDDPRDLMFRTSPVDAPSDRDKATLRLLYALPPGSLRVQP